MKILGVLMIIEQIPVGSMDVFSYLIGCDITKDALVIDPGGDVDIILAKSEDLGLNIKYILNTHHHWDHTIGNSELKKKTGAKIIMHSLDYALMPGSEKIDILLKDETLFELGKLKIRIIHTPGHTPGGICLYIEGNLFTGDTLFVGDSGRTDLQGGHRPTLGASIRKLMELPDDTVIWPGHNYGSTPTSTVYKEKRTNINAREYGYFVEDK